MPFSYQAEKFAAARRALMLPHTQGEHTSIFHAFHECSLGLHQFDSSQLGDDEREWIRRLEAYMDTSSLKDPMDEGTWVVKARSFSQDEKIEISRLVDELAHTFDRSFRQP